MHQVSEALHRGHHDRPVLVRELSRSHERLGSARHGLRVDLLAVLHFDREVAHRVSVVHDEARDLAVAWPVVRLERDDDAIFLDDVSRGVAAAGLQVRVRKELEAESRGEEAGRLVRVGAVVLEVVETLELPIVRLRDRRLLWCSACSCLPASLQTGHETRTSATGAMPV